MMASSMTFGEIPESGLLLGVAGDLLHDEVTFPHVVADVVGVIYEAPFGYVERRFFLDVSFQTVPSKGLEDGLLLRQKSLKVVGWVKPDPKTPFSARFDWKMATKWRNSGEGSDFLLFFRGLKPV